MARVLGTVLLLMGLATAARAAPPADQTTECSIIGRSGCIQVAEQAYDQYCTYAPRSCPSPVTLRNYCAVEAGGAGLRGHAGREALGCQYWLQDHPGKQVDPPFTLVQLARARALQRVRTRPDEADADSRSPPPAPAVCSAHFSGLPANYAAIANYLVRHGFTRYAAAGVVGNITVESGGDPKEYEIGGGGGGGLIQWTPYVPSLMSGTCQQALMKQLQAIVAFGGGPGLVDEARSASSAASIYDYDYERPEYPGATVAQREQSASQVYQKLWGRKSKK